MYLSIKQRKFVFFFFFLQEIEVGGSRKAIIIFVPVPQLKSFQKIQVRLVRELEKKFSGKHVVFIAQVRLDGRSKDLTEGVEICLTSTWTSSELLSWLCPGGLWERSFSAETYSPVPRRRRQSSVPGLWLAWTSVLHIPTSSQSPSGAVTGELNHAVHIQYQENVFVEF